MTKITHVKGDITKLSVDAIVNAANSSLAGGGGVDGAIHKAAGPELLKACLKIREEEYPNGLPTGEAVITPGFLLPSKYVIHTVGPIWKGGNDNEEELLSNCYRNSLELANRYNLKSIAFPAISTGAYGYPKELASKVAEKTVREYVKTPTSLEEIIFVKYI